MKQITPQNLNSSWQNSVIFCTDFTQAITKLTQKLFMNSYISWHKGRRTFSQNFRPVALTVWEFHQLGPLDQVVHRVAMSVCLSVFAITKHPLREVEQVLVKGGIVNFMSVTSDMWHGTCEPWQRTCDMWKKEKNKKKLNKKGLHSALKYERV